MAPQGTRHSEMTESDFSSMFSNDTQGSSQDGYSAEQEQELKRSTT